MIRVNDGLAGAVLFPTHERVERDLPGPPERLAFAVLWTTGSDPRRDGLFRVAAVRATGTGSWEPFAAHCRPGGPGRPWSADASGSARMAREFGVHGGDLDGAPWAAETLAELAAFLRERTVIVPARAAFVGWLKDATGPGGVRTLGLAEIAALCLPGRLAAEGDGLAATLLARSSADRPRALQPTDLQAALGILVARILAQDENTLSVLAHSLSSAARALRREKAPAVHDVELALALLEHPSRWVDPARALEPESTDLRDGRLTAALERHPTLYDAVESARPRWAEPRPDGAAEDPPSPRCEEVRTLDTDDRRCVDEIFQEHLPRALASAGREASYREGQHAVASVIAEGFGVRELRLVHAPTGTGKTLAYLVPCALWAARTNTRVAVATFTRALQEQALERETPLALSLLRSATGIREPRVTVLKGRENYLCWRALCLQQRGADEPAEELLAWSALALFALDDPHGDMDRFPARAPLEALDPERWRRAVERLSRAARSASGCCAWAADRATCAAEVAWRRAERAHVVITNHALALARRDHFHHVVFDECEHLHDVALNAFSSSVSLRSLHELLSRLSGDGRRPLDRVASVAPPGSAPYASARTSADAVERARSALLDLGEECRAFHAWRAERARERQEADQHSLFREYALGEGVALCASHAELSAALTDLATGLAELQEGLDGVLPAREGPRLRRTLELLRMELEEERGGVAAWIPREESGRPVFGPETFHDLEASPSGDHHLVVRVLLPHEYLGRHYYPQLAGAVLLSATTWLRGGFDSAAAYLGLARAAVPADGEEREPMAVRSFRAPEAFDYSRVLLSVPRDAPPVTDKNAYLDYVARFVAFLAERTRGRLLALFTNGEDLAQVGAQLEPFFAACSIPFWWQRMRGVAKEELGQLFRSHVDSVLLGLDTFWHGADFPGTTLEYLVIARLPYGVPDRYHHAQCAALGSAEQRRTIYLPRALSKFRQGFGRLMRTESDRGAVFVLDRRVLDPRHRGFLDELPLSGFDVERGARLIRGDTDACLDAALAHMEMKSDVRRRGLERSFLGWQLA